MFSGVLAGVLRVAAVAAVTAGLGTGIYFVAQSGGDDSAQVPGVTTSGSPYPRPLSPPDGLSPPDEGPPPEPTATYPPAPITPGPEDTSDWETYASPLGFTIKYPSSWLLIAPQVGGVPTGEAEILNEVRQEAVHDPIGEGSQSGDAWLEIQPQTLTDLNEFIAICTPPVARPGHVSQVNGVTVAGLPAVRCAQSGQSAYNPDQFGTSEAYFVALPSGRVVGIVSYAIDADPSTIALLQTMFSTLNFQLSP